MKQVSGRAAPTSSEEFVMQDILKIRKKQDEDEYHVLVEWEGYDRDASTWETLSAMLEEDAELVKTGLRGLNLSWRTKEELNEQYGIEL